jgi:hypothetical protein
VKKTDIYVAVFHSTYSGYADNSCGKAYLPLSKALKLGNWPYDVGDDPSFFSQATLGSNLTWGVCRPQVRNRVSDGDIVIFVSVRQKNEDHPFEYCLCSLATVERKVRQTDIWRDVELKKFQRYLNLLIRPHSENEWEHFEPGSEEPHKDWVWRIATQNGLLKGQFQQLEAENLLPSNARIDGHPVSVAKNYVIFSANPEQTRISKEPTLIALCGTNGEPEEWIRDASALYEHIFGTAVRFGSDRRSLRTTNKQHSHPAIRWTMPTQNADKWRSSFFRILDGNKLL